MKYVFISISFIFILTLTIGLGKYFSIELNKEKLKQKFVILHPIDKRFIEEKEVLNLMKLKDSEVGKIELNKIEENLKQNPYISKVEVYNDLNNNLFVEIDQYKPIARIIGNQSYYLDSEGKRRPLSKHYTENVILVFGNFNKKQLKELAGLINKFNSDPNLRDIISEMHYKDEKYYIRIKDLPADIILGKPVDILLKLDKLIAIKSYLKQHNLSDKYKQINLEYNKQVVCN